MTPAEIENIVAGVDPGVRKLVALLLKEGFDTTDSGDGISKFVRVEPDEYAMPFPHVVATVNPPWKLVEETERMFQVLTKAGVTIVGKGPEESADEHTLEGSFSPVDGTAVIILTGVSDLDLT